MATLNVNIYETAAAVVIRLEGEAGIRATDGLQIPLQRITVARPALVILDMSGLQFAASIFLGLLVNFRRGLVAQGSRIQLAGVQPKIRELFHVIRLEELFEFVPAAPPAPSSASLFC